jgi:hypothetical protein
MTFQATAAAGDMTNLKTSTVCHGSLAADIKGELHGIGNHSG